MVFTAVFYLAKHIKSYRTLFVVRVYMARLPKLKFAVSLRIYVLYMTRTGNLWYVCRELRTPSAPI